MNNLQYVVGMILHVFTHYLYYKYPEKTPIGKERFIEDVPSAEFKRAIANYLAQHQM